MKPAVDEMFPEGAGPYVDLDEAGGSTGLLMDLAANEKAVHADFFNDFEDLFDDDDTQTLAACQCHEAMTECPPPPLNDLPGPSLPPTPPPLPGAVCTSGCSLC
ncbi:COP9 signalosome complex subunit 9 [Manis javanica]|nr:COP9 signalosome complex subunit 9 [Manis javanica]